VAKRLLVLVAVSLVLPATALAATVHVRVEGKTRTLFAPTTVTVQATTAYGALQQAALLGEIYVHVTASSFGNYVDQVGMYGGSADSGWAYKVDNASPPVAADQDQLKDGDTVLWYYATFGATGGPPTLQLNASGKGCYTVAAYDDNGKPVAVSGVNLQVGSKKRVAAKLGTSTCVGVHKGLLVRATAIGAVRSNALA
jgi:hypothetical protein